MVLRDCNRGMVHWPEEDRNLPVDVELQGEEIFLYFKGYKFQDSRFVSEIDFYDKQQGMIVTLAEVVMKRNPAFPDSPYPWMGICDVKEVLRVVQRQNDVRVSVAMELPFVKEEELKVYHHEMHINIKINNVNRCIPLPNVLRKSHIVDTKLENGNLYIHFQVEKKKEEKS